MGASVVDLIEEAARLQFFLEEHHFRHCFIGGLALQWWGEPRLTRDIAVSLLAGYGGEEPYVDLLLANYTPRLADAKQFALTNRVLLIRTPAGISVDISLGALPYEELAVERSILAPLLPGLSLRICSAEDLLIMKLFAGRELDVRDARSVVVRQGRDRLDWHYITTQISDLAALTDSKEPLDRLEWLQSSTAQ